jgi:pimeloyl-ACP methyl ester carboxylesterase
VMAHGLGGIRSAVLPDIAQRFAAAGIAALVFDYRHLGASEGAPRGLVDSTKQRQDYRAAIAYARSLPGIDPRRTAAWGTSFSGGHVLTVAADDPQLAAAVIQNPFVDGRAAVAATLRAAGRARTALLVWEGLRDQLQGLLGRDPHRVALAGPPGTTALMTTPDAVLGYASILPDDPVGWEPAVPARIVLRLGSDRPGLRAPQVRCPLLVCVCDHDLLAPPSAAVRVAQRAPRGELRRYPIGHFDLFSGHWLQQVVADQVAFLRRTLLADR